MKTTPERSIKEIVKEFGNKFADSAGYTMTEEVDLKDCEDWLTQTLQAERQKREEIVKEALEEAGNFVGELYQSGNMGENEYMLLTDWFDEKLTQPNNQG